jgi:hypothetical protein
MSEESDLQKKYEKKRLAPLLWVVNSTKHAPAVLALMVQLLVLTVLMTVPFGFDHPSSWGLDYSHLLIGILFYCLAVASGVFASVVRKQWWLLGLQTGIALIAALAFLWPFFVPDLLVLFGRGQ